MSGPENIVADRLSRPSVDNGEQLQTTRVVNVDVSDLPEEKKVQEFNIGKEYLLCDKCVVPLPILPVKYGFIFSTSQMNYSNLIGR